MESILPMYLYHYTTTESLREILKNKTLKFSRVDKVNDPYEGFIPVSIHDGNIDVKMKYIYCSCWSPLEEESVAMWEVYTKSAGVRIKMKYDMFLSNGSSVVLRDIRNRVCPAIPITPIFLGEGSNKSKVNVIYGPLEVIYESSIQSLNSAVAQRSIANKGTDKEFVMNDLSLIEKSVRKINHWRYENEYRFIISPYIEIHGSDKAIGNVNKLEESSYPSELYIPFHKNIEEVVLGPEMDKETEIKLREYLKNNGVDNVTKSTVKMTRRVG